MSGGEGVVGTGTSLGDVTGVDGLFLPGFGGVVGASLEGLVVCRTSSEVFLDEDMVTVGQA
jgi:hypothetical protein